MDNQVFVHDEDIPHIHDNDDYEDDSRYDTPDMSRIEETSFTEQPAVKSKAEQRQRLLHDYIEDLYKHLEVDPGNVDLVDTKLFKVENSTKVVLGVYFKNDEDKTLVRLTKQNGNFRTKAAIQKLVGGVDKMKKILVTDDPSKTAAKKLQEESAKKLQEQLPTDLEIESIPAKDLSTLAEQVYPETKEAATNTDLDMQKFLGIDKILRRAQGKITNNATNLTELDKQLIVIKKSLRKSKMILHILKN